MCTAATFLNFPHSYYSLIITQAHQQQVFASSSVHLTLCKIKLSALHQITMPLTKINIEWGH